MYNALKMRNYIPYYFNTKHNIILLLWITAVFGELFILFFQPMESRTWVSHDWQYLLWTTIVVLVAVGGIALSRTIMYHFAKRHAISYLSYAVWIAAEVSVISMIYASFPLLVFRAFSVERELTLFYLFKEAALATAFILLIPYAFAIMWMVLVDRGAQIHRLKAELERASGTAEEPQVEMFNFYDERGELKLSVKPEMLYYIEAADNYVQICYTNAGKIEKLMVRNTLKNVEWRFRDKGLVRCHRSYVVNVKNVKLFRRQESEVLLEFGDSRVPSIPVSKGFGDRVMAELS